jgi:hypothetical protein
MSMNDKLQLSGWILFVLCAILFIISSLQSRDTILLIGSILFLVACVLFIIPLIQKK